MPICIPYQLSTAVALEREDIFIIPEGPAPQHGAQPLDLLILAWPPVSPAAEAQLLRALSNTPFRLHVRLLRADGGPAQEGDSGCLLPLRVSFDQVMGGQYDGMIITGASASGPESGASSCWDGLCRIMAWARAHVRSTLYLCHAAQAGLAYHYGIPSRPLPRKLSGVYEHTVIRKRSPLFRGFDDRFHAPHSRYAGAALDDLLAEPELEVLALSGEAGVFGVKSRDGRQFFIQANPEYDGDTLAQEYFADLEQGLEPPVPAHYFPDGNPSRSPVVNWRCAGQLFYANWLNYYVCPSAPCVPGGAAPGTLV